MQLINTAILSDNQIQKIDVLWNQAYPKNLINRFAILLTDASNYRHFIIENDAREIVAWAVLFDKENETRFSIIVGEASKGMGLGGQLMDALKQACPCFYGWVIDHDNDLKNDGTNYPSPLTFYLKHGFEVLSEQRLDTPIIKAVKVKWSATNPSVY
jgi:predicted GNAT family N-acyltransferase